jgi:hypothetical protein
MGEVLSIVTLCIFLWCCRDPNPAMLSILAATTICGVGSSFFKEPSLMFLIWVTSVVAQLIYNCATANKEACFLITIVVNLFATMVVGMLIEYSTIGIFYLFA